MPIEVDLGCARGHFLEAMARLYPDRFFLGVERLKRRYEKTMRRIMSLSNAGVWCVDCREVVEWFLPQAGIETIHISFPDPWPKRRHFCRRLVSPEFLQKCEYLLAPGGRLRLMTDHLGYFNTMQAAVGTCGELSEEEWDDGNEIPMTEFQKRFSDSGIPIYRLLLRRADSEIPIK